jgi:hypothetical protein
VSSSVTVAVNPVSSDSSRLTLLQTGSSALTPRVNTGKTPLHGVGVDVIGGDATTDGSGDSDGGNTDGFADTVVSGSRRDNQCKLSTTRLTLLKTVGRSVQSLLLHCDVRSFVSESCSVK